MTADEHGHDVRTGEISTCADSGCVRMAGHAGRHEDRQGAAWCSRPVNAENGGKVTVLGPHSVLISDADDTDASLTTNAATVLALARRVIGDPSASEAELRFSARALADSLNDVLMISGHDVPEAVE